MKETIKVPQPDGSLATADLIEINQSSEHWSEFLLEDGSAIKVKIVGMKIYRARNKYDADGNPLYILKSTNVVSVTVPEKLKRKDNVGG